MINESWKGFMIFHDFRETWMELNEAGVLGDLILMLLDYSEFGIIPEVPKGSPLKYVIKYHLNFIDQAKVKQDIKVAEGRLNGVKAALKRGQLPSDVTIAEMMSEGTLTREYLSEQGFATEDIDKLIKRAEEITGEQLDDDNSVPF